MRATSWNFEFIKQLELIALYLNIFNSVKSRDLKIELLTISTDKYQKTLWIGTKGYFNSTGIKFHRKGIKLFCRKICVITILFYDFTYHIQVWTNLAQWFLRRRSTCEKLTHAKRWQKLKWAFDSDELHVTSEK